MHDDPQSFVDLRSDTVTLPTEAMRRSVLDAPLGDDVIGHDPTVERLQHLAAQLTGKAEALFVSSGTMGNLLAVACHTQPGDEAIVGEGCHVFNNEAAGSARVAGVQLRTVPDPGGRLDPAQVAAAVRPPNLHQPISRLVCTENTHNGAGGVVVPLATLQGVQQVARQHGLAVHLDGARLFHAVVASGVSAREWASTADSVTFCLSKGLCCPAGSLLCGSAEFIARARRLRKQLGGGMRQLGFLAAPGIVALETMIERLADDHRRARRLAEALHRLPGVELDLESVQTNIVYFRVAGRPAAGLAAELGRRGVACLPFGERLRLVTHHAVDDEAIARALTVFGELLGRG